MSNYSTTGIQTIRAADYTFQAYSTVDALKNHSGVYIVIARDSAGNLVAIDVGESIALKYRAKTHDRKQCWVDHGAQMIAARYTPGWTVEQRRALEAKIRNLYRPVCGDR